MTTLHPDSAAIDRIGAVAIRERFGITRQALFYWRRKGIPNEHRRDLISMGRRLGHDMSDIIKFKTVLKRGRRPTSGKSPTSLASPA